MANIASNRSVGIGGVENGQGGFDQLAVRTEGDPRPANPQRDRPHPFVVVRLNLLLGAKHGHGPVAEVIVQLVQSGRDDPVGFVPRPALPQHRLAHPADEERLKQPLVGLVEQQVAVELAIGRQGGVEDQPQHRFGLIDLLEDVRLAVNRLQFGRQQLSESLAKPAPSPASLAATQVNSLFRFSRNRGSDVPEEKFR